MKFAILFTLVASACAVPVDDAPVVSSGAASPGFISGGKFYSGSNVPSSYRVVAPGSIAFRSKVYPSGFFYKPVPAGADSATALKYRTVLIPANKYKVVGSVDAPAERSGASADAYMSKYEAKGYQYVPAAATQYSAPIPVRKYKPAGPVDAPGTSVALKSNYEAKGYKYVPAAATHYSAAIPDGKYKPAAPVERSGASADAYKSKYEAKGYQYVPAAATHYSAAIPAGKYKPAAPVERSGASADAYKSKYEAKGYQYVPAAATHYSAAIPAGKYKPAAPVV